MHKPVLANDIANDMCAVLGIPNEGVKRISIDMHAHCPVIVELEVYPNAEQMSRVMTMLVQYNLVQVGQPLKQHIDVV